MKLISNSYLYLLNLKAGYSYISFCCLLNHYSIMRACIEVRLICKIPIIAIPKLIKTISDQATMFSCINSCIAGGSNVKYVHFNLLELSLIVRSTNSDGCYPAMTNKISNFLYDIQYVLFEMILKKITLAIKPKYLPSCLFFNASNSFNLQY